MRLYGFDALLAYRASRGSAEAGFVVARRWSGEHSQVMLDIREPASFAKWAVLMLLRSHRSDDLFVYVPPVRRVLRLNPALLQHPIFELVSLGDLRPIAPGELVYTGIGREEVEGQACTVIEGRPLHAGLGFERVELAVSDASGFSLRSRYYRGERELRRVLISPADLRGFAGRQLPARRRILLDGGRQATVVELLNVLLDPALPDRFFSKHTLRAQRFPSF